MAGYECLCMCFTTIEKVLHDFILCSLRIVSYITKRVHSVEKPVICSLRLLRVGSIICVVSLGM